MDPMEFQRFWVSGCHPPGWFHDNYFMKSMFLPMCFPQLLDRSEIYISIQMAPLKVLGPSKVP